MMLFFDSQADIDEDELLYGDSEMMNISVSYIKPSATDNTDYTADKDGYESENMYDLTINI